jgi:hypothetical protein
MNTFKHYRLTLCTLLMLSLMPPPAGAVKFVPSESLALAEDFPLPALIAGAEKEQKVTLGDSSKKKSKTPKKKHGSKRSKSSKHPKKSKKKAKKSSDSAGF